MTSIGKISEHAAAGPSSDSTIMEVEQQTEIQKLPAARRRPNITTEPRREMSSDHISLQVKGDSEDPEAAQEDSKSKKTKNNRWTDQDFSDAFDDLYKLNAFIVFAFFISISLTALGQRSLQNRPGCDADPEVTMEVIEFGAISFGRPTNSPNFMNLKVLE